MMKTTKLGKRKAIPLTNWTHLHLKKVLDLEQRRGVHVLRTQHAQCCSTCVNYQALLSRGSKPALWLVYHQHETHLVVIRASLEEAGSKIMRRHKNK